MGAVLLFGFLVCIARRIETRPVRLSLTALSVLVLVTVGPARIWDGAHWPTDVISAYALGGLLLIPLLALEANLRGKLDGLAPVDAAARLIDLGMPLRSRARNRG
jgi:membrane-associated phospholipid phosphatase